MMGVILTAKEKAAKAAGAYAFRCERPLLENPHPPRSWERVRWAEGWREAQAGARGFCHMCGGRVDPLWPHECGG